MIQKCIACITVFFVISCSNIEFVLKNNNQTNPLKNKTVLLMRRMFSQAFKYEGFESLYFS